MGGAHSDGVSRVKPSDHFMPKAKAISSRPATPTNSHVIASGLGRHGRGRPRAEADAEAVEGVHQADGVGEVGQFGVVEFGGGGRVVGVRYG
jgi:hypothetical protein